MLFWVPVAITGVAAVGVASADILTGRRQRAKSRREAAAKFRATFTAAIADLDYLDAHAFITEAAELHDAAISEFRRFVQLKQRNGFDVAVRIFSQCRNEVQPPPIKVRASLDSGKPIDNSDVVKLKEALNELLTFAENTQGPVG